MFTPGRGRILRRVACDNSTTSAAHYLTMFSSSTFPVPLISQEFLAIKSGTIRCVRSLTAVAVIVIKGLRDRLICCQSDIRLGAKTSYNGCNKGLTEKYNYLECLPPRLHFAVFHEYCQRCCLFGLHQRNSGNLDILPTSSATFGRAEAV